LTAEPLFISAADQLPVNSLLDSPEKLPPRLMFFENISASRDIERTMQ